MSQGVISSRDIAAFTVCGVAVAGAALVFYQVLGTHQIQPASVSTSEEVRGAGNGSRLAPGPDATATLPAFDVVRIEPNGDAVLAGRAAPGATITVLRIGSAFAEGRADSSGTFALVLQLPAGASEILLQSNAIGGTTARSAKTLTAVIAEDLATRPMVALSSANEP